MIKFSPLAMQGKNLLSCRVEFLPFSVYIAYAFGMGYNSLKGLSLSYHCIHWLVSLDFPRKRVFLPTRYRTFTSAVLPWRQAACSSQLSKERKTLSCNPNVCIRTSLTFGIPTSNAAGTSSPAPLPGMGWFLILLFWKV